MKANKSSLLTSSVTGPDDGVASPRLLVGVPLRHSFNLNRAARPGARGVRFANTQFSTEKRHGTVALADWLKRTRVSR